jgi:hypothetical protein
MARKVDEAANFVFMLLIEQEPRIYDPDYARQDKIDLAWERISHETKESEPISKQYKRFSLNCHSRTDVPNVFFF